MVLERDLNPYQDMSLRVPFYITSSYRESIGVKGVSMKINPENVSFRQNKRITRQDTQGGAVFFHWTNMFGRNNDILELDFSGQTGNINMKTGMRRKGGLALSKGAQRLAYFLEGKIDELSRDKDPVGLQAVGDHIDMGGAAKILNFWNLYSLTREPMVDPRTGAPIYYYINYNSTLLGNTYITFIGHFNRVLEFSDSADSPFSKNYSFGFTAISSIPSMDYIYTAVLQNISQELIVHGGTPTTGKEVLKRFGH
jgi:hypothetical protein